MTTHNDVSVDETLLRRLLATIQETVILIDVDRTILYVNRPGAGYDPADVIGTDLLDYVPPAQRESQARAIEEVLASEEPSTELTEIVDKEGNHRWYRATSSPLTREGEVVALVISTEEVTELQLAREEIGILRELLPVCAWCGEIRGEDDHWYSLEDYAARSGTRVTHSVCPACAQGMTGDDS